MVDDPVPAETLVDLAVIGKELDAKILEARRNASNMTEGAEQLKELDQEVKKAVLIFARQTNLDKVELSAEQISELGTAIQHLRGLHLPIGDFDTSSIAAAEYDDFENTYAYREVESGINREGYELDIESSFEVLVESGVIVQCDGCERQVLAENSHRFAAVDGDVLCGSCRNVNRDKQ